MAVQLTVCPQNKNQVVTNSKLHREYSLRQNVSHQCFLAYNTPNFGAISMKIDMYVYFFNTKIFLKKL